MKRWALCAFAACGSPDAAGGAADGSVHDATPGCTVPSLDAPWLQRLLTESVAQLASTPRATTIERNTARIYLADQITAIGWTPQTQSYASGMNVFATIPATTIVIGTEIIVGAHFDSVPGSPGANDNASGVAVVLAVARYLHDVPCRAAPVTIVLFDEEELGLFGSRAFAQQRVVANVRAVHTIDQVAWDRDGDKRFELELPTATLAQEYRSAATVVGALVTMTTTQGTDHQAFRDRGFAAIGLTEEFVGGDTSPHRHQSTDIASTVNAGYLVLAAKLTAQVIITEVAP